MPTDRQPFTVTLGELGDYRAVAAPTNGGYCRRGAAARRGRRRRRRSSRGRSRSSPSPGSRSPSALGAVTVRRALGPLGEVTETATLVSEMPLARATSSCRARWPSTTSAPRWGSSAPRSTACSATCRPRCRPASRRERKVRRFVADASHELRTPLASIRGYAELTACTAASCRPTSCTRSAASSPSRCA